MGYINEVIEQNNLVMGPIEDLLPPEESEGFDKSAKLENFLEFGEICSGKFKFTKAHIRRTEGTEI